MPDSAEPDRRQHSRVPVQLDVELETGSGDVVVGRSLDLSVGGIKMRASRSLHGGEVVYLVLGTEDRVLAAVGEVVGSSTLPGTDLVDLRVRFRDLSDRRRQGLDRIVHEATRG
ncbi:MAG TPA: PilZ domain-containing protein [Acidimicrobiales bacterium]